MRLLPLGFVLSVVSVSILMFSGTLCQTVDASPSKPDAKQKDYVIRGKKYEENGIVYDIPGTGNIGRGTEVVSFPNRAVIPSYVTYNGTRYAVRKIRKGAAQTLIDNPNGWVTLPPTLRYCDLMDAVQTGNHHDGFYTYFYGVRNVNVTNLDSFLNMEYFRQFVTSHYFSSYYPEEDWKLYLNGEELKDYDYVYPEGASMGVSLQNLLGVRSITIPASDTLRTKPLNWWAPGTSSYSQSEYPEKLQFKADSGYDIRLYNIVADTLVMPGGITELDGYGTICDDNINYDRGGSIKKYTRLPEGLKVIHSMSGLPDIDMAELPKSLTRISDGCFSSKEETLTIPSHWENLNNVSFRRVDAGKTFDKIVIEESDVPLYIDGEVRCGDPSTVFYFDRNIIYKDANSYFRTYLTDGTIIFGPNVTELPEHIPLKYVNVVEPETHYPKYVVCKGLTPPNFPTDRPEILKWCYGVTLVVPEEAAEAYRNHPVWRYFITMLTDNVDEIQTEKQVVGESWHSLDGLLLSKPEPGKINIKVTTYSDGTTATSKVAIPE